MLFETSFFFRASKVIRINELRVFFFFFLKERDINYQIDKIQNFKLHIDMLLLLLLLLLLFWLKYIDMLNNLDPDHT